MSLPLPEGHAVTDDQFVIPNATGQPLISARRDDGLIAVTVTTRRPGEPARIAPSDARDLAAALSRLADEAEAPTP